MHFYELVSKVSSMIEDKGQDAIIRSLPISSDHSDASSIQSLLTQKDIGNTKTHVVDTVDSMGVLSVLSDSSSISSQSMKEGIGSTKCDVLCRDIVSFNEISLKEQIQTDYNALFADWEGKITFPAYFNHVFKEECNILHFVGDLRYRNQLQSIRFCSELYPIEGGFEGSGFTDLTTDLCRASVDSGFSIAMNGNYPFTDFYKNKCQAKRFSCIHAFPYRGNTNSRSTLVYRNKSYHCDRKNSRGREGINLNRRSNTTRSLCKDSKCSCFFLIGVDHRSFFVVNGLGKKVHSNHIKLTKECISIPSRLVTHEEKKMIKDMYSANVTDGTICNVLFEKTGQMLTRQNMKYLTELCDTLKKHSGNNKSSNADKMIQYIKDNHYKYLCIQKNPDIATICNVLGTEDGKELVLPEDENPTFSRSELGEIDKFVADTRIAFNVQAHQKFLMGIAWVIPCEKRIFELFPEVVLVDTTQGTNNEDRPLLTMTGKDSNGKMFTFLRAFMPNEKSWSYRWIFSIVMPHLFGNTILNRIQVMITDGDSQEYGQLDNAIIEFMPHVTRVRCGWHIIQKGWESKMMSVSAFPLCKDFYYQVSKVLKDWLYSFMKENCETREEYLLSKKFLLQFVNSTYVTSRLGTHFPKNFDNFFRHSVEAYEANFCFYQRRWTRHYGEYTNSCHEGTNKGIKYNSAPVLPGHSISKACIILSSNAERSTTKKKHLNTKAFMSSRPHSTLSCGNMLVENCECRLESFLKVLPDYEFTRKSKNEWLVTKLRSKIQTKIIPVFKRVRTVSFDNGVLRCSCPHTIVYGEPCVHAMKVAYSIPGYTGVSYTDYSVVWWKQFFHLATQIKSNDPQVHKLNRAMMLLREQEVPGIHIDGNTIAKVGYPVNVKIPDRFLYDSRHPEYLNDHAVYKSLSYEGNEWTQLAGLSQDTSPIDHRDTILDQMLQEYSDENKHFDCPDPYRYLIQSFKELTNVLRGNTDEKYLYELKQKFSELTSDKKNHIFLEKNNHKRKGNGADLPVPVGIHVSSNISNSKRRKKNVGCRGY